VWPSRLMIEQTSVTFFRSQMPTGGSNRLAIRQVVEPVADVSRNSERLKVPWSSGGRTRFGRHPFGEGQRNPTFSDCHDLSRSSVEGAFHGREGHIQGLPSNTACQAPGSEDARPGCGCQEGSSGFHSVGTNLCSS